MGLFRKPFRELTKNAVLWTVLPLTVALFYAPAMDSQIVGMFHDDGVYAMTAEMIAAGKGFVLPNLPDTPAQIKYPILYPLILALGWKANPNFPQNIPLLHWLTTLFLCFSAPLLTCYLRQVRQLGWPLTFIILTAFLGNFFTLFYSTLLMSEAPYFFLSLLTIFLIEKWNKQQDSLTPRQMGLLILLSALVFHTRTVGIALIAGLIGWFLLQRNWRSALTYGLSALSLSIIPWFLWVKSHTPKVTELNYPTAFLYGGYGVEFSIHSPNQLLDYVQALLEKGLWPLMQNLVQVFFGGLPYFFETTLHFPIGTTLCVFLINGLLLLTLIRVFRQKNWSPSGLYIGCYILLLCLWLYPNQAARFLIVVQPWLWLALIQSISNLFEKQSLTPYVRTSLKILACVFLAIFTYWPELQGYQFLKTLRENHRLEPSVNYVSLWPEYQEAFSFIRRKTPVNCTIASIWDPTIYLYTGRHSFGIFSAALMPDNGQVTEKSFQRLYKSLKAAQVKYIIDEPYLINQIAVMPENPVVKRLRALYPNHFEKLFESSGGKVRLYQFQ